MNVHTVGRALTSITVTPISSLVEGLKQLVNLKMTIAMRW